MKAPACSPSANYCLQVLQRAYCRHGSHPSKAVTHQSEEWNEPGRRVSRLHELIWLTIRHLERSIRCLPSKAGITDAVVFRRRHS